MSFIKVIFSWNPSREQKQLQQLKGKVSFTCSGTFKFFVRFLLAVHLQCLSTLKHQAVYVPQIQLYLKLAKSLVPTVPVSDPLF